MLPGPVFGMELVTSARRLRYYLLRVLYCFVLGFLIWVNYDSHFRYSQAVNGVYELDRMASFAQSMFWSFTIAEGVLVLLMTPAFVAGTIAEEKQRRTLHYLLASRLSSAEIVLGKLFSRLLHLGVYLILGLPIFSLLTLFGGVPPEEVFIAFLGLASTAWFLGCLAIMASTVARRTREAITIAYLLVIAWLFLPPLVSAFPFMPSPMPEIYEWIGGPNEWVAATNPIFLVMGLRGAPIRGAGAGLGAFAWFFGLQIAAGFLMAGYAVARLRPIFRAQEGGKRPFLARFRRAKAYPDGSKPARWNFRVFPRRPLGDDPMMWKETQTTKLGALAKVVAGGVALIATTAIVYALVWTSEDVFRELRAYGYDNQATTSDGSVSWSTGAFRARDGLNGMLRFITALGYVFLALAVASRAAGAITGEKEQDTWISLATTDLAPWEIVRAKMVGALWGIAAIPAGIVLLWLYGAITGAIHPAGLILNLVQLGVFLWFIVALGVHWSLWSKSTMRSMSATVLILLVINVGYLFLCIPFEPDTIAILLGMSPAQLVYGMLTYGEWHAYIGYGDRQNRYQFGVYEDGTAATLCFFGLALYGAAAAWLTIRSVARFDRAVDRPQRPEGYVPPAPAAGKSIAEPIDWDFGDKVSPAQS